MNPRIMSRWLKVVTVSALLGICPHAAAQSESSDYEALKLAAVEALIAAPPERALPLARKVLEGNNSDELKERALFVLSQLDEPEAQQLILLVVRNERGDLRNEAIRMIGIGGDPDALRQLSTFFADGDEDLRDAILEAYLIAGDEDAVYQLAIDAPNDEVFAQTVEILSVMGAHDKLRLLRDNSKRIGNEASEALIEAFTLSGDIESLRALATDASKPEQQLQALEGLGVIGIEKTDTILLEIYRSTNDKQIRESVMEGLMISGNDQAILELFQSSNDANEKRQLLEILVVMDSDAVWQVIDETLDGGR